MAKVQFFTQKMIDQWVAERRAEFDGETLKVLVGNRSVYRLKPATMFLDIIDGTDTRGLKGKVLSEDHLQALKADVYLDSGLIGETAYKVEPGFVVAQVVAGSVPAKSTPASETKAEPDEQSLADLVLKSLSGQS